MAEFITSNSLLGQTKTIDDVFMVIYFQFLKIPSLSHCTAITVLEKPQLMSLVSLYFLLSSAISQGVSVVVTMVTWVLGLSLAWGYSL